MLIEEAIDEFDLFIAVTNDDEANIMSSLLAKKLGVRKTMVLIQRDAYMGLLQDSTIDIAISPQHATISALLTHVRKGEILNVYSLRGGSAEAIEIVAKGSEKCSKVVGRTVGEIKLPPGTTIGAIVRQEEVHIAHSSTLIHENDHIILFLVNKRYISDVEKLFQVTATLF
jgi:trk system potassium uptake protein TrkA